MVKMAFSAGAPCVPEASKTGSSRHRCLVSLTFEGEEEGSLCTTGSMGTAPGLCLGRLVTDEEVAVVVVVNLV